MTTNFNISVTISQLGKVHVSVEIDNNLHATYVFNTEKKAYAFKQKAEKRFRYLESIQASFIGAELPANYILPITEILYHGEKNSNR